jgi:oxygen-independent coproporphyrinogen-3 oxidase
VRRVADGTQVAERREVDARELPFEFMMNALRLAEGFEIGAFADRTGLPITVAGKALAAAEAKGLISRDHLRIRPTDLGRRFLNDLLQLFLPEQSRREKAERA